MKSCTLCADLLQHRTQVVLPIVDKDPHLFFMGEAPGLNEDREGKPFVGAAGGFHRRFLEALGNPPRIVCNVINCRPTTCSGKGRIINDKPTPEQIQNCSKWVNELIVAHMPSCKLMVLYGAYPMRLILNTDNPFKVSDYVGKFFKVTYAGITFEAFGCYHPATLVYNRNFYTPKWKELTKKLKEKLK